jgi:hypothetical protein
MSDMMGFSSQTHKVQVEKRCPTTHFPRHSHTHVFSTTESCRLCGLIRCCGRIYSNSLLILHILQLFWPSRVAFPSLACRKLNKSPTILKFSGRKKVQFWCLDSCSETRMQSHPDARWTLDCTFVVHTANGEKNVFANSGTKFEPDSTDRKSTLSLKICCFSQSSIRSSSFLSFNGNAQCSFHSTKMGCRTR